MLLQRILLCLIGTTFTPEAGSSNSTDNEIDIQLQKVLGKYNLTSLLPKLSKAGVDEDILWELDDNMLDEAGLTMIEKAKYRKTKQKHSEKSTGKIEIMLPPFLPRIMKPVH